jgi:ABC-type sugar transport system ATPase subunit
MTRSTNAGSPAAAPRTDELAVVLEAAGKRFGSVVALDGATLALEPGKVHAFVGQNGAGKSTCLGLIAGRISASAGSVTVCGSRYPSNATPQVARRAGATAIYQELSIIPAMSALENAFISRMDARAGIVDFRPLRREFADICDRLGVRIEPDAPAGRLSLADQQMLEIIRALLLRSRVLLLDEPTAALAPDERAALFSVMRDLRSDGVCLVLVSHYLDEVLEHADSVTVFRDGRVVETRDAKDWTEAGLVRCMLGTELRTLERVAAESGRSGLETAAPAAALRIEGLSAGRLRDVSLDVRPGEVVGLGGLVGSGRSTLLRALAGVQPADAGRLWIDGDEVPLPRTPRDAWRRHVGLIPEDRKVAGVMGALSARENIVMADLAATGSWGVVRRGFVRRRTEELAAEYGLPATMLDRAAGKLSGGNQQKLLFARWGFRSTRILLADEATRGIDIGAKGQILETLRRLADQGLAVLFVSSELEEVAAVSDRVYVLHAGRLVAELDGSDGITQNDILNCAFGLGAPTHA